VLSIIELGEVTCEAAVTVAEVTGQAVPFLTFDARQAQAARALGLTVVGV
jgi:hypothetical protein